MTKPTPKPPSLIRRCLRLALRLLGLLVCLIAIYFIIALIGLIPVNNDFEPAPDGIKIYLTSTSVHADIVLPIKTETIDWREHFPADDFRGDVGSATHVALGWGDKGFFIHTPTWSDLNAGTAVRALLWPSDSCMHVSFYTKEYLPEGARSVNISSAQYKRLVDYINDSFQSDESGGRTRIADAAYGKHDAFYEARGYYHCFNTCNCWVGGGMQSAGIRTGWFTPLPKTIFLYLPE